MVFEYVKLYFLNDKFDNRKNSFAQLKYLKTFIQCGKIKALKIHECLRKISSNDLYILYIYSIQQFNWKHKIT